MHPRTIATLEELDKAEWFACVGVKDTTSAIVLSSWQETIQHCESNDWLNLRIEASNQFCERIVARSKERFIKWNEIAIEVKKTTEPFVRHKISATAQQNNLPSSFEQSVQWDIIHVCMEAEYADLVPPAYYAGQAYWYVKGHFPCGWEGEFPKGKLIVY